jgi:hypothetical protein
VSPTVGLLFPGDTRDASTWSGTPAGIGAGLRAAGVEVAHVRAEPSAGLNFVARNGLAALRLHRSVENGPVATLRRSRHVATLGPELAAVRTWAVNRRLRDTSRLDGIVQIGTGYSVSADLPTATFEDMTTRQAVECGDRGFAALSRRAIERRVERQRAAYQDATACCVATDWAADSIVDDYGIPREKVHIVGVGRNHSPSPPARRDWSRPRFLFVGREWDRKNGERVLRVFGLLRAELGGATLDVVGRHPPIDAPGVTGHGWLRLDDPAGRRRIEELFQAATCFLLPSQWEPAGIAYLEAGGAGLPSIGSTVGGAGYLIGEAGRLVHPMDEAGLLGAMREMADPETAARLGALAERRAALFTWRLVAERILRALRLPGVPIDPLAEFL